MARTARRKGIGGPFRGRTPKVVEPKDDGPPLPDTKEELIEALSVLCDDIDAQMAKEISPDGKVRQERNPRHYWGNNQPWRDFFDRRDALTKKLAGMLGEDEDYPDYVRAKLVVPDTLGQVPSFARPGFFVIWVDFIPIGCAWEGFIAPRAQAWALDPNKPWVNAEGQKWINENIGNRDLDVAMMFRNEIEEWTKAISYTGKKRERTFHFQPVALTPEAKKVVGALREGMPWLTPILQRGPVNPIPMPSHIKSVQMALA